MAEEFEEYIIFTVTDSEGKEVEMAVVDEFDYNHRHYVAAALVEGDSISEDGMYIYRVKETEDDFTVEKIESASEYKEIAEAYMEME